MPSPDAPPRSALPARTPGFLHTCRLAPDGRYMFDAPTADIEQLCEVTPDDLGRMLTAGKLPFLSNESPELWASIRESAEHLTPWVGDNLIRGQRTGDERWVRVHA